MKKMKLNIQLFGGSVSINGVSETVNQSANTSSFNITATMSTTSSTYNYSNAWMELQYKFASSGSWTTISRQTFGIGKSSSVTRSWDLNDVAHNSDGTLEDIQFRVDWYITNSTNGTTGATTYTPTSIPRGSKFIANQWDKDTQRPITSSLSFPATQYINNVYHKLQAIYVDSGTEYVIATRTGVSINNGYISFAFTSSEINSVGSLMSFDTHYIRMFLYTYTDSAYTQQLGDVSIIWWNGYVPNYFLQWGTQTVTDSVSTYDSYKPNVNTFIAGLSKPTLTFSASSTDATHGTYGKTISYAVNGTTATSPYTDNNLTSTTSYTVTANDGRATQISWNPTLTIIPYTLPNIPSASVKVTRPVPTIGEVEVSYTANYYDGTGLTNLSNATYNFYYKENESDSWGNPVNQLSGSGTSGNITFTDVSVTGLDYKKPFYFKIELTDRMGIAATTYIGSIPKGEPVWNAYTDSNDENVFNVNGKAIVKDDLNVDGAFKLKDFETLYHDSTWGHTVLASDNANNIYLRPNGRTSATGQAYVEANGKLTASGEVVGRLGSGYGQLRAVATNYGFFIRNDDGSTYFMLTNSGDANGSWNSLRPIYINNSSGRVGMANGLDVTGALTRDSRSVATMKELYSNTSGATSVDIGEDTGNYNYYIISWGAGYGEKATDVFIPNFGSMRFTFSSTGAWYLVYNFSNSGNTISMAKHSTGGWGDVGRMYKIIGVKF